MDELNPLRRAIKFIRPMTKKSFENRLEDLKSNAKLLIDACDRFIKDYDFDEVKNIGVRLRVIVGSGHGSGLLFELFECKGDHYEVMALNQFGVIKIQEVESDTGRVVQKVEKKALLTKLFDRLPIVFPLKSEGALYKLVDFEEWIRNAFLLDWDVPKGKDTPAIRRFTPQALINRYTGQEAAHSDSTFGAFGGPLESFCMEHKVNGKIMKVPVVYEHLYEIGRIVASISGEFIDKYST